MKRTYVKILISLVFVIILAMISYSSEIKACFDMDLPFNKDFNQDGKIVITIDPGHGGSANGTYREDDFDDANTVIKEKDINLEVSKKVAEYLKSAGIIKVVLTRDKDINLSLAKRAEIAGKNKSDLMISIHFNARPIINNSASNFGTEVWQSVVDKYKPRMLPTSIFKELNKNHFLQVTGGLNERTGKNNNDYYGVIREGCKNNVPTIILECCFFTNETDFKNIKTPEFIDELSKRIAMGIIRWYAT